MPPGGIRGRINRHVLLYSNNTSIKKKNNKIIHCTLANMPKSAGGQAGNNIIYIIYCK